MGRGKRGQTIQVTIPPADGESGTDDGTDAGILSDMPRGAVENELESFLDQIAPTVGNATIDVYRIANNNNSKHEFVCAFPIGHLSYTEILEKLRDEHGGGEFRLHVRDGERRLLKNFGVTVERKAVQPGVQFPQSQSHKELFDLVRAMSEQSRQDIQRILDANKKPGIDWMKLAPLLIPMMQPVLGKLFDVMTKRDNPVAQIAQMAEVMRTFREMMPDASGGGEGDTIPGVISAVKPLLGQLFEAYTTAQAAKAASATVPLLQAQTVPAPTPAPIPQFLKAPAPAPVAAPEAPAPLTPFDQLMDKLRRLLVMLCRKASEDRDPAVYAEVALDEIPEEHFAVAMGMLQQPDWFNTLVQIHGEVAKYPEWFEEFHGTLLQAAQELQAHDDGGITAPETMTGTANAGIAGSVANGANGPGGQSTG